ncbi:TetR/AcrR family transcriptional regulator [Reichenbachiella ulvae]|uniref:TetR/AcrR family transcriptional regulator n=1 Tax=Reichenbachiella ulvae TaxID=2980104 RepID=A0ABT3CUP4_9BACT|nr:TetR/AcrR family transcriptional regulator [Reichenbachiella ulvae]MCV9387195.1 TetR/AcrR family transcriptional regulator [Reichenbachiella ulvae]
MLDISLVIEEKYFNKDPQSTDLGRSIISASIELMDELGFEHFTFKKLATKIQSTEASVYRYFDNKLKLLLYLTNWYWAWLEYQIDYNTHHLSNPDEKLKIIIKIISQSQSAIEQVNLPGAETSVLRRIVMSESDKTYLNKQVDQNNHQGLFRGFKKLCNKIATVISELDPDYKYPHALGSSILEASHQQAFFAQHLPSITDVSMDKKEGLNTQVCDFIEDLAFKVLSSKTNPTEKA